MSAPKWAVGMRKIGPGMYVDASHNLHVKFEEICESLGVPPTPWNIDVAELAARDVFAKAFPKAKFTVLKDNADSR